MTAPARPGVSFRTLGCKVNQVETEDVAAELIAADCAVVREEDADVVVVNTCSVTGEADRKARKEVNRALRLPRSPVVLVTGCLAALDPEGLRGLSPRVVVEADKSRVAARLRGLLGREAAGTSRRAARVGEGFHTRGMVKVEDGCDAYCAYCIVPYARGVPRSVPLEDVVAEVEELAGAGVAEVVLTGINIGRYADGSFDLADLVSAVASTGVRRIRLSSIEPLDLGPRLLGALAVTPAVCPHLHVPLQAGSDRVLRAMDRGYDTATYTRVLREAREAIPGLAVSTDVIAGFPGETAAEAVATREFVEECAFTRLHVFRYSARQGTLAASMPGQVDAEDRRVRARRLRDVGDRLSEAHASSRVGGRVEVLVERVEDGIAEGTSEDYVKVRFEARDAVVGVVLTLTVISAQGGRVTAGW